MAHIFKVSALYLAVAITMPGLRDGAYAAEKASSEMQKRLQTSAEVLTEMMAEPEKTIPAEVLARAKCVAVIPSVVKVALGVGGRHGKGLATCRTTKGWSAPGPISISGGSIGLQIGTQSVDIILVILDRDFFKELLVKKFKIGSEDGGTPGPTGSETARNDWRDAKILTYSRSHGVFAGVTLKGATLKQDKDGIVQLYGRYVPIEALLEGKVAPPRESHQFLATVRKYVADAQQHSQG
jgi:lipid-binding SYLF domain-containing protein